MKRTYRVTVLVDVGGDTEADFKSAVKQLREEGVWLDCSTGCADGTAFSMKSRRGAVSVRCRTTKVKL